RRHTRSDRDWSSDVCSSDLGELQRVVLGEVAGEEDGALGGGAVLAGPLQGLGAAALEPADWEEDEDGGDGKGDERPGGEMAHGRSEERRVGKECRWGGRGAR